jgi:hypothetical protein
MIKFESVTAIRKIVNIFYIAQNKFNNVILGDDIPFDEDNVKKQMEEESYDFIKYVTSNSSGSFFSIVIELPNPRLQGSRKYIMPKMDFILRFSKDGTSMGKRFVLEDYDGPPLSVHPHVNAEGEPCLGGHERGMNFYLQNNSLTLIRKYAIMFQNTWTRNDAYWDINNLHDSYKQMTQELSFLQTRLDKDKFIGIKDIVGENTSYNSYVIWYKKLHEKFHRVFNTNTNGIRFRQFLYPSRSVMKCYEDRLEQGYIQDYFKFVNMCVDVLIWVKLNQFNTVYSNIESKWRNIDSINFSKVNASTVGTQTFNQCSYIGSTGKQQLQKDFVVDWLDIPKFNSNSVSNRLMLSTTGLMPSAKRRLSSQTDIDISLITDNNISFSKRNEVVSIDNNPTNMDKFAWILINVLGCRADRKNIICFEDGPEHIHFSNMTYWAGNVGGISRESAPLFFKLETNHEVITELVIHNPHYICENLIKALVNLKILNKLGFPKKFKDLLCLIKVNENHGYLANGDFNVIFAKDKCIELYDWIVNELLTEDDVFNLEAKSSIICYDLTIAYNDFINNKLLNMTRRHNVIKEEATRKKEREMRRNGFSISDTEGHARQSELFA